jgi:hypothetical protein
VEWNLAQRERKMSHYEAPAALPYAFNLDVWLTVYRSITLVDLQLDALNSYLFTYNTFIKILYMFWALPCSSSGGLRSNCICAASGIKKKKKVNCLKLLYYMMHHVLGDSIDTQFNHIRRIYLKFYYCQFSLTSNVAKCNTVILDNSLFTEWRYQRLHIYNYDVYLLKMSRVMLEICRGF